MKKSSTLGTVLIFLIMIIPLVYAGSIYSSMPETIPLHFGIDGKADRFGNKSEIWFVIILMTVVSAGVYLLISNLPKIDPKKTAGQSPELYHKIAIVLVVFLCALNIVMIYSCMSGSFKLSNLMLPLLGLLFAILGNYMHSIKPNYFVGFRTPWTLENEDNWRKTHQLVGKLWVPGGILITISTLLLPTKAGFFVFLGIVVIITVIPGIYSYLYFKKQQQSK